MTRTTMIQKINDIKKLLKQPPLDAMEEYCLRANMIEICGECLNHLRELNPNEEFDTYDWCMMCRRK